MLMAKGIGLYEGMKSYNICLIFAFACIFLKLLLEEHTILELVGIIFTVLLGLIIYIVSGDKAPLIYLCMIIGLRGVPIIRVFKLGLPVWFICMLVRAVLAFSGIEKGFVLAHEKLGLGPILRWGFGYPHPNVLQISYAVLVAFVLYLTDKRGKELCNLLFTLFIGNCFIFLFSVSYTGFALTTLLLIIFYYCVARTKFSRLEKIIINSIMPFSVLFSTVGPLLTGEGMIFSHLDRLMNKILNMRFIASRIYLLQGISLFGKDLSGAGLGFALDCSYVSLLMNDGIILFLIVMALYAGAIFFYLKSDKRKELAIILSFIITGISEPFLFNTSFKNLSFLFLGEFIFIQIARCHKRNSCSILTKCIGGNIISNKFTISISKVYYLRTEVKNIWNNKKRIIIVTSVCVGLFVAFIYGFIREVPNAIYVSISNTDCPEREKYYLDIDALPDDFNSLVYEYQSKNMPLYKFDGNMIKLERIRDIFGWWFIGAITIGSVLIIFFLVKEKRE